MSFKLLQQCCIGVLVLSTVSPANAQRNASSQPDWQGTQSDYERMNSQRAITRSGVTRDRVQVRWVDESLAYRVNVGRDQFETYKIDIRSGSKSQVDRLPDVKGTRMLDSLKPSSNRGGEVHLAIKNETGAAVRLVWINRSGRKQAYGEIAAGETTRQHTFIGHVWLVENNKGEPLALFEAASEDPIVIDKKSRVALKPDPAVEKRKARQRRFRSNSPDGKWKVAIRDHNVFLLNRETNDEKQLTENGTAKNFYSNRFEWSPNSRRLMVMRTRPAEQHTIHMIESSPREQTQPKLHSMRYLKPGDDVRRDQPCLFDIIEQKQIPVPNKLFENPYQIREGSWTADGSEYRFLFNQRGHKTLRYVGIDGETGKPRAIIDETSKTFVDYAGKYFLQVIEETDELIWMSERDGWNHLYLIDAKTGDVKNQITKGQWVVRAVERVDIEQRKIYFRASGWYADQDPYFIHFGHVGLDGKNLTKMTAGKGNHSIEYSPDQTHFVATYSRVDMPPVTELRRTEDGKLIAQLEKANDDALRKKGWVRPQPFVAKGRDEKTDIHGVIYFPSGMDANRSYPVIEYIYAGPHSSFVPKSYFRNRPEKALAELGFIVVQIDGMGTSNRSKAFHDVCWKNLGDSGFPDRIAWMKAAKEKYPQMDLSRVGIYGGSAGGQSALRGLLAHSDFYKAAVSDCGCHDNRMDKIWWNELWMSWPVGPHYKEQSNVTNAHKLKGKLLLIVGELDRNVDPASTMQVVNALIIADKDFELLVVPGAGHGIGSGAYGMRRTRDFFVRNLIGKEPRSK